MGLLCLPMINSPFWALQTKLWLVCDVWLLIHLRKKAWNIPWSKNKTPSCPLKKKLNSSTFNKKYTIILLFYTIFPHYYVFHNPLAPLPCTRPLSIRLSRERSGPNKQKHPCNSGGLWQRCCRGAQSPWGMLIKYSKRQAKLTVSVPCKSVHVWALLC